MCDSPELQDEATCANSSATPTPPSLKPPPRSTSKSAACPSQVYKEYAERATAMDAALKREPGDVIAFEQPQGGLFFWAKLTGLGGKISGANEFAKRD